MTPDIAVIIVNWNGRDLLPGCLESVSRDDTPMRVIVVDNASSDGSADLVEQLVPPVELIRNPRNDGWARGNNVGIRRALDGGARYVVLFNTDTRPAPGWAKALIDAFESDAQLGAVGFTLFHGRAERLDGAFAESRKATPSHGRHPVNSVSGAAIALRAEALRSVGLIDETYFMYCDDMDLCERLRRGGWTLAEVDAPVRHFSEGSSSRVPLRASYLSMRNTVRFHLRYRGIEPALRYSWGMLRIALGVDRLDDPDDVRQRYRPGPWALNALIWSAALTWNVLHLPRTLTGPPKITV